MKTIDDITKSDLSRLPGAAVRFGEPMSRYTSLGVGGPAEALAIPQAEIAFQELLALCRKREIPITVIGNGTNLLVGDSGIDGIVILLTKCHHRIFIHEEAAPRVSVIAMAGARLRTLCEFALSRNLEGLNVIHGIPGTVGGAIMMNAGTTRGCTADRLKAVTTITPEGITRRFQKKELNFGYRTLSWPGQTDSASVWSPIIISAEFELKIAEHPEALNKEAIMAMQDRRSTQPGGFPNAGCFFKNPPGSRSAGELIDRCGLKGKCVGGAEVSTRHANFLFNRGDATAADFLNLMGLIKKTVKEKFDIGLEAEIKLLGRHRQ
jgi:UDP-N-acetylmuramate dehydrogenase